MGRLAEMSVVGSAGMNRFVVALRRMKWFAVELKRFDGCLGLG